MRFALDPAALRMTGLGAKKMKQTFRPEPSKPAINHVANAKRPRAAKP
jgi:hypothetical protein